MTTLQEEVKALQKQLVAKQAIIDQQNKESKEIEEKSWEYNMNILEKIALAKEREVLQNNYAKFSKCKFTDIAYAPFLKSSVNCLQRLDERLTNIETLLTAHINAAPSDEKI